MNVPYQQVHQAVQALGIDVPVMRARAVGGRLELSLYGGQVLTYPSQTPPAADPAVIANPHLFNRPQLRQTAAALGIENASCLNKAPLIAAIRAWRAQQEIL